MANLQIKKINKICDNKVQAVFDLEIKDIEFIVFIGPSGYGKSTTLAMNFIDKTYKEGKFCFGTHQLKLNETMQKRLESHEGKVVILGIRPEDIYTEGIVAQTYPDMTFLYQMEAKELLCNEYILHGKISDIDIIAKINARDDVKVNDVIDVTFDENRLHFFDVETKQVITL